MRKIFFFIKVKIKTIKTTRKISWIDILEKPNNSLGKTNQKSIQLVKTGKYRKIKTGKCILFFGGFRKFNLLKIPKRI